MDFIRKLKHCDYDLTKMAFNHMSIQLTNEDDLTELIKAFWMCNIQCNFSIVDKQAQINIPLTLIENKTSFNTMKDILLKQGVKLVCLR